MQPVSDEWLAEYGKQLTGEGFVDITLEVGDTDAAAAAAVNTSEQAYYSNAAQISDGILKPTVPYATLETNLWVLDGSRAFLGNSDPGRVGFVGEALADEGGFFPAPQSAELCFSAPRTQTIPGITVVWGDAYGEYAEVFNVTVYNGTAKVASARIEHNTSVRSDVWLETASAYDRIRVDVIKWCLPHRRARICEIYAGIKKSYDKRGLTEYEHEQSADPIAAELPRCYVRFSLDNRDGAYDPNNNSGLNKYLTERQKLRVRYGTRTGSGNVEYIDGGIFRLTEWEAPQNGIEASFTARDPISVFLKTKYALGNYQSDGVTLASLALAVLSAAKIPKTDDGGNPWVIDDSLSLITATAPLPLVSGAEALQYIAQAGCVPLWIDRKGRIRLTPFEASDDAYALNDFNLFSRPELSLQTPISEIRTKVYRYFTDEGESGKELYNGTVALGSRAETVLLTYSQRAHNVQAEVTGATLIAARYYSHVCKLRLQALGDGDVTVKLTGDPLKNSNSEYVQQVGDEGEVQTVDNPLITSAERAAAVSAWVKSVLEKRRIITSSDRRADPRLDAGDIVSVANRYGEEKVRMSDVKYTFRGAFRGSCEGRVN